jgi:hypothetical protein
MDMPFPSRHRNLSPLNRSRSPGPPPPATSNLNPTPVPARPPTFPVPGSATTNRIVAPLTSANGAVFYRLVIP